VKRGKVVLENITEEREISVGN